MTSEMKIRAAIALFQTNFRLTYEDVLKDYLHQIVTVKIPGPLPNTELVYLTDSGRDAVPVEEYANWKAVKINDPDDLDEVVLSLSKEAGLSYGSNVLHLLTRVGNGCRIGKKLFVTAPDLFVYIWDYCGADSAIRCQAQSPMTGWVSYRYRFGGGLV